MMDEWRTRKTLLMRAMNSSDEEAWADMVVFYENFIYHILRRMKLDPDECDDLAQEILVKLWKNLKKYDADKGRFRAWLGRIVHNAAYDYFKSIRAQRALVEKELEMEAAFLEGSPQELEKIIEEEWMQYVIDTAMQRMKEIFSENAVAVFSLSMKNVSTDEIACKLNLTVDSVYTLKNRVKARFIREVHALIREAEVS